MPRPASSAAVSVERFFQFALLGLVASGFLAVAGSGYLDMATIALTAGGLVLRGLLICGWLHLDLSEGTVTVFTLAYAAFFGLDYLLISRDFLAATVHLVCFLAVMKILSARGGRDYLYTAVISFLELLAAAILSINLNFFLFLALYLMFAIAALTSGEIRRSLRQTSVAARGGLRRFHPRLASLAALATIGILVITACFFFVLPRTADAAFARLISHRIYLPGFSSQVTLGEIGEIKNTNRPVMHVRIFSRDVPGGLKWRGGALTEFDGRRWSNPPRYSQPLRTENGQAVLIDPPYDRPGLYYHVDLNATDADVLFLIGTPVRIETRHPRLYRTSTGSFRVGQVPPQGLRYDAYSLIDPPPESVQAHRPPPVLPLAMRERFLQLPRLDPRIEDLARSRTVAATTDLQRARSLERHLRRDYGYTLDLLKKEVADPLAHFLFVRKQGHCEYFASAMTVMLRTMGIPARLVNGFQSGTWNPISELWVVRASDAHSWVEAWIPGYGWTTFDPTPPDPNTPTLTLLSKLALYADAAETFWQEWVVGYDLNRQGTLADKLEQGTRRLGIRWFDKLDDVELRWKHQAAGLAQAYGMKAVVALGLGVWIWLIGPPLVRLIRVQLHVRRARRGQASPADATLLYDRMLQLMKRRGYQKPAWFTPAEFAASLPSAELGGLVREFTTAYNAMRFGGRTDIAPELSSLLTRLESAPRRPA